jgi:Pentapeptide repeats (8 copies)
LITSIPKDGPIALADWRYFQGILITQSRALVTKGDLVHHRQFQSASPLTDDERAARTIGKLIASNVRKGVVADQLYYRGIYCEECDFHGAAFPQGTDFTGAILDRSNFSGANLGGAVFDNAELAGTKFVEADLRQAKFRSLDENLTSQSSVNGDRVLFGRTAYIDHIASALDLSAIMSHFLICSRQNSFIAKSNL